MPEVVISVVENLVTVTDGNAEVDVNVTEEIVDVTVGTSGPQGAQGPTGATGPAGPTGPAGGSYTHNQTSPQLVWVVNHNLGFNPAVTTLDTAGSVIEADFDYLNSNSLEITFTTATSGIAYLS